MAARVATAGADLGLAFDGDADRCILADERGEVRDGDAMLYLWARDLHRRGELGVPAIVATSMSNLGLERALAAEGIALVRCDVGDRDVVETLRRRGLRLGGEQSGHVVDLARFHHRRRPAHRARRRAAARPRRGAALDAPRRLPPLPADAAQRPGAAQSATCANLPRVVEAQRDVDARLGADGRLVLRYSGTEPLARIMIEGPDQATIDELADLLESAIRRDLGIAPAPPAR